MIIDVIKSGIALPATTIVMPAITSGIFKSCENDEIDSTVNHDNSPNHMIDNEKVNKIHRRGIVNLKRIEIIWKPITTHLIDGLTHIKNKNYLKTLNKIKFI